MNVRITGLRRARSNGVGPINTRAELVEAETGRLLIAAPLSYILERMIALGYTEIIDQKE